MKDLTVGSINTNFIKFSIPVLIGSLLSMTFNLIDTIIAGKMLGEQALASISAMDSLITIVTCAIHGIVNGMAVLFFKGLR